MKIKDMREEIIVKCNINDEIQISDIESAGGVKVVLVDEKNAPIARYEFGKAQLQNIRKIRYSSNNTRIKFIDIIPTSLYELQTACD